jgi:myo-inositol 2-dehydrogenase/D-chiro-inositol 1-dehydrogenase
MPLSVGLIGLGEVAQLMHLPLLADDPRFAVAAVTDASPGLTARIAARYGARPVADAGALIADPGLDAVFILTPDHLHAGMLGQAIAAGKHVFIEKPVCLTLAELKPLIEENRGNPRVVFVGYMRRFSRPFLELARRMPDPATIRHVKVRDIIREAPFFQGQTRPVLRADDIPPAVLAEGRRRTAALVASVTGPDAPAEVQRAYELLTGLSSHSFSAMRELLGPPKGVLAACQHGGETVVALFDYGHFTAVYEAVVTDIAEFDCGIDVLTSTQRFRLSYDTPYIRHLPTRLTITTSGATTTGTEIVGPVYEDPFRVELDAFHDAVTLGAPYKTTLEDSRHDLRLFAEVAARLS